MAAAPSTPVTSYDIKLALPLAGFFLVFFAAPLLILVYVSLHQDTEMTRAVQVAEEGTKLAPTPGCRIAPIIGGQRMRGQLQQLRRGCAVVVGTPGRVLDHLSRGTMTLDNVRYVVLDEADRMLDIGFRPDIERILRRCPSDRQTHLLSATMPPPVMRLTQRYMIDPLHINVSPAMATVEKIRQSFVTVDEEHKFDLYQIDEDGILCQETNPVPGSVMNGLAPILKLGATTGLRRGELSGLRRDRLHLERLPAPASLLSGRPAVAAFSRFPKDETYFLYGSRDDRMGLSLKLAPEPLGVHLSMAGPCGVLYMIAPWGI
jgi:hypothetical protein